MKPNIILPADIAAMDIEQVRKELHSLEMPAAAFCDLPAEERDRLSARRVFLIARLTQILERPRVPFWWNALALLTLLALALVLLARLWPR